MNLIMFLIHYLYFNLHNDKTFTPDVVDVVRYLVWDHSPLRYGGTTCWVALGHCRCEPPKDLHFWDRLWHTEVVLRALSALTNFPTDERSHMLSLQVASFYVSSQAILQHTYQTYARQMSRFTAFIDCLQMFIVVVWKTCYNTQPITCLWPTSQVVAMLWFSTILDSSTSTAGVGQNWVQGSPVNWQTKQMSQPGNTSWSGLEMEASQRFQIQIDDVGELSI